MMAAVSLGQYKTMDDCLKDWVTPLLGEAEAPDAELAARYAAHFPAYQQSRKALAPTWRAMAQTRGAA